MIVVSNASLLIALSRIDLLHILKDLFAYMYIPDTVYQETVTNCGIIFQKTRISQAIHEFIKVVEPKVRHVFSRNLGAGEQGVLNLALEKQAQLVLMMIRKRDVKPSSWDWFQRLRQTSSRELNIKD